MKWPLLFFGMFLFACSDTAKPGEHDSVPPVDSSSIGKIRRGPDPVDTVSMVNAKTQNKPQAKDMAEVLAKIIPSGWNLLDTMTGDLNRDQYLDMLVILRSDAEESFAQTARPLIILLGNAENGFDEAARNDSVVLCQGCGGIFGDPYDGMAIRNGYFSIEHYGGSSWRWTRIITFKYNDDKRTWYLHRDAGVSYHTGNPEEMEETATNQADYGKLNFTQYRN